MGVQASDAGEEIGIGAGVDIIYGSSTSTSGTDTPDPATRCFYSFCSS